MDPTHEELVDLLELQRIDLTIDRLELRKRNLPEQQELDQLEEQLAVVEKRIGELQTVFDEVAMRQSRMDSDIEMLASKIAAEEQRLYSGDVSSPRELSGLQAEIESLKRRQSQLEDNDLEVMEEKEAQETLLNQASSEAEALRAQIAEASVRRDAAMVDIAAELEVALQEREKWAPKFDPELLAFYDEVRESKGGVGAAALVGGMCQGCHMVLPAQEVDRVKKSTGIVRCDECRRILVVI